MLQIYFAFLLPLIVAGDDSRNLNITCPYQFYEDIKPLFRTFDRENMLFVSSDWKVPLDLWGFELVKLYATGDDGIYAQLQSGRFPTDNFKWSANKLSRFKSWMDCGMPSGSEVDSDRETFYRALNAEENYDYLPKLKGKLKMYLQEARQAGFDSDYSGSKAYREFKPYTPEYFNNMLEGLLANMSEAASKYQPWTDTDMQTKPQVIDYMIQQAPFNLIDGQWISRCCKSIPTDELHSLLFGILMDEVGDGDPAQNHCNVYSDTLHSIGYYHSPVTSRDFAFDSRLLDQSFTVPAYAAALAVFSDEFFPELLGSTLQIEWTSSMGNWWPLKLLDYWGLDSRYFALHLAIDNAASGHGYRARRAVELYLDQVRAAAGEAAVQAAWRRIWDGFLAFDALGEFNEVFRDHLAAKAQQDVRSEMIDMIERKQHYARLSHMDKQLGDTLMNDWFAQPEQLLDQLAGSSWLVPSTDPETSPVLSYLTSFEGPMFHVFLDSEIDLWRRWIVSLARVPEQAAVLDSFGAMRQAVLRIGRTAMVVPAHEDMQLWGCEDLKSSSSSSSSDGCDESKAVQHSVHDWLVLAEASDPVLMMSVIRHPRNKLVTPGDPAASSFLTHLLSPSTSMGQRWGMYAADASLSEDPQEGSLWTWTDIATRWVRDGCPLAPQEGKKGQLFAATTTATAGIKADSANSTAIAGVSSGLTSLNTRTRPWVSGRHSFFLRN